LSVKDEFLRFMLKPMWWPLYFQARRLFRMDLRFPCFVLSRSPAILLSYDFSGLHFFIPFLKGNQRVWLFVQTGWTYHSAQRTADAKKAVAAAAKAGNVIITFLANSEDEYRVCQKHEIPALICSATSFIDERIFTIDPLQEKRYKAVYDARLRPFKRHELAALVDHLALITYREKGKESQDYNERAKKSLVNGVWLNDPFGPNYRHTLDPNVVAEYLNQAEVGLMLSAEEGGCYASLQYLLCGLPVVSTRSVGGRSAFYDPDYVAIVDDTPEAVAEGVERMRTLKVSPEEIRSRTLRKVQQHRGNLIRRCQEIYMETDHHEDFSKKFRRVFEHKFTGVLEIQEFKDLAR
jgi:glycosyltransferase involved in cell wall biosynthesis